MTYDQEVDRASSVTSRTAKPYYRLVWLLPVAIVGLMVIQVMRNQQEQRLKDRFDTQLANADIPGARQTWANVRDTTWRNEAWQRLDDTAKKEVRYAEAKNRAENKDATGAIVILEELGAYRDALTLLHEVRYAVAEASASQGNWSQAKYALERIPVDIANRGELWITVNKRLVAQAYADGTEAQNAQQWQEAVRLFEQAKTASEISSTAPADLDSRLATSRLEFERVNAIGRLESIRKNMDRFTGTVVQIAVGNAKFASEAGSRRTSGNSTFVNLYVHVRNTGSDMEHANPNHFRLSNPDGYTAAPHVETYGFDQHFPAVDLSGGQNTSGWLVFYLPKADVYTLSYKGFDTAVDVLIAPE